VPALAIDHASAAERAVLVKGVLLEPLVLISSGYGVL
jgi:hypothetical protein